MYALSSKFKWTPDQIRALDNRDYEAYLTMLSGENKGARARQEEHELKLRTRHGRA